MNQRTTQSPFTNPERKLGGAMLLLVGMLGVVGCEGKKVAPQSTPTFKIISYAQDGKELLAAAFQIAGHGEHKLAWSIIENGQEAVIAQCTFTPTDTPVAIKTVLVKDKDIFSARFTSTNNQPIIVTPEHIDQIPDQLLSQADVGEIPAQAITTTCTDENLYSQAYSSNRSIKMSKNHVQLLGYSKKFPTVYFLTLHLESPPAPQN